MALNQRISLLLGFAVAFVFSGLLSAATEAGEELFRSKCAGCHGLDGRGGEHAPDIATVAKTQQLSDTAIVQIVRDGKPAAGMPSFRSAFNEGQIIAVVTYLRILQGRQMRVQLPGDPKRGRALFFGKAQCSECHMIQGQGGFIAADLSTYGQTHSAAEIREAIVNPNKNVDGRRGTLVVASRDGGKFRGVVRNEDNFSLQLQTFDGTFHFFDKSMIADIQREPRSLMPERYGAILDSRELDHLVSYIAGRRNADDAKRSSAPR